jgi:TolA-binding protein
MKNISEYEKRLSEIVQSNTQNIEKTKELITSLTTIVDSINKEYVSKVEYNALVTDINKFKDLVAKELKKSFSSNGSDNSKESIEVYKEALEYFDKKYYSKALENYELLITRNYRPAFSHYMIGEINYKRKKYADALTYFKKSSSLYSEASYMPRLMLHTAISMEKTGDKKHAEAFFNAIVTKFSTSKEAAIAKKHIGL